MKFSRGHLKFQVGLFLVVMALKPSHAETVEFVLSTPSSQRYSTGWIRIQDQPSLVERIAMSYEEGRGCLLFIDSPVWTSAGGQEIFSSVYPAPGQPPGTVLISKKIQFLYFTYYSTGQAKQCRVQVSITKPAEPKPPWNSQQALYLAKQASSE